VEPVLELRGVFRRTALHPLFPLPRVGRRRLVGKGNLQVGDVVAEEVTTAVIVAWSTAANDKMATEKQQP
jgi:hypothetical protein